MSLAAAQPVPAQPDCQSGSVVHLSLPLVTAAGDVKSKSDLFSLCPHRAEHQLQDVSESGQQSSEVEPRVLFDSLHSSEVHIDCSVL